MFGYKTEVMTIKEFMGREKWSMSTTINLSRKQATKLIVVTGAILLSLGFGDVSFAAAGAVEAAVTDKVISAFDPLIQLVKALSYPVAMVCMLLGGIQVMVGHSERGLSSIQKAGGGFVLVQLLPTLLDLLVEITRSL